MKSRFTKIWRIGLALVLAASLGLVFAAPAAADVSVVPATGGDQISADTADDADTPAWTTLNGPTIIEGAAAEIGVGTIVITAPAGFEFNEGQDVTAAVSGDADQLTLDSLTATPTATTITFTVSDQSVGNPSTITFSDIQVQPTTGAMPNAGFLSIGGGAGVTAGNTGALVVVTGNLDQYLVVPEAGPYVAGAPFDVTITAADQHDNPLGAAYNADQGPYTIGGTANDSLDGDPPVYGPLEFSDFSDGIATVSVTLYKAEDGVKITVADNNDNLGESGVFDVDPAAAFSIALTDDGNEIEAGDTVTYTLIATDEYGNEYDVTGDADYSIDAAASGTWGTDADTGKYTAENIGFWTVTAGYGELNDTTPLTVEGMQLDAAAYNPGAVVTVTVVRPDANTNPENKQSIGVTSGSDTAPINIVVALQETGNDTSIFTGQFTLVADTPGPGQLLSQHGDTITVEYNFPVDQTWTETADVDDVDPTIGIVSPVNESTTNDNTPVIEATLADGDSGIDEATIVMMLDGEPITTFTYGAGSLTYTSDLALEDGVHIVTLNVSDKAGNAAEEASWSFTIDASAPIITIMSPEADAYINNVTPVISVELSSGLSGIDEETILIEVNGANVTDDASYDSMTGILTYTPVADLVDGVYAVIVDVDDNAGNSAIQASWAFTVDTTDPILEISEVTTPTGTGTQTISGTYTEVNLDEIVVTVGGTAQDVVLDWDGVGTWRVVDAELTEGDNAIVATITDRAANEASDDASVIYDATGPVISDTGTDPAFVPADTVTDVTFFATVTDALTEIDSVTIDLSELDGVADQAMTYNADNERYEYTYAGLEIDTTAPITVAITAEDAVENETTANLVINPDDEDPVISGASLEYPFDGVNNARPGDDVIISVTVTDNLQVSEVKAASNAWADVLTLENGGDGDIYTGTATIKEDAARDTYDITITSKDAADNEATPDTSLSVSVVPGDSAELAKDWNFISIPKKVSTDSNTVGKMLRGVDWSIVYDYDPVTGWTELGLDATVNVLDAYWVKTDEAGTMNVFYAATAMQLPASKEVIGNKWNAIGFSDTTATTAQNTLLSIAGSWSTVIAWDAANQQYAAAIFAPGDGANMNSFTGYWVWVTQDNVLSAISG